MPRSRPKISIPARTWVDLYAATSLNGGVAIPVGTKLLMQAVGRHGAYIVEDDQEPDIATTGNFYLNPLGAPWANNAGNIGLWAFSYSDTFIQVEEF